MIIVTSGHVDHGKTALLQALTGTDTTHLPEEKKRGMTIDLGYAYLPLADKILGFIDVPGHEKFLANMLAGLGGIHYAMLIVAADEDIIGLHFNISATKYETMEIIHKVSICSKEPVISVTSIMDIIGERTTADNIPAIAKTMKLTK